MMRRARRQRSLVEVLLPDADKLWDPTLRRIDDLLDDEVLVDRVAGIKELKAKRAKASPKATELSKATKASWDRAKEGFAAAYHDLVAAYDKAAAEFKK
jgi:hypothetical protein